MNHISAKLKSTVLVAYSSESAMKNKKILRRSEPDLGLRRAALDRGSVSLPMRTIFHRQRAVWPILSGLTLMIACQLPAAPAVEDIDSAGLQQLISSYTGKKAVLINVWATWCLPCVKEFPDIVRLQKKYPADLQVVFISADAADALKAVESFLDKQSVDWKTYRKVGKDQVFIDALSAVWTGAIPATRILDKQGKEVAFIEGIADFDTFDKNAQTAIGN